MRIGFFLIIMLTTNLVLMLFQSSIDHIIADENLGGDIDYYNDTGTLGTVIESDGKGVKEFKDSSLPSSVSSDVNTGGFSDLFNTFKTWLVQNIPGAQLMMDMVNAMPKFLKIFFPGAPELATLFGAMWNLLGLFLLISWLRWNF